MSILIKNQDMPKEGEKYLLEIRHDGTVYDAIGQRVAAIAAQFDENASPWHRVEDGLPEPYVQCLVRDNDNNCAVGYYRQDAKAWDSPFFGWLERDDEYYKDGDLCRIGKVVAWMPIEPQKEDKL